RPPAVSGASRRVASRRRDPDSVSESAMTPSSAPSARARRALTRSRHQHCFELRVVAAAATLALGMAAATPAARAQGAGDPVATYESHVRRGTELFQAEDFAGARGEFQAAYDLHAEPTLLFNIASTHRREGDVETAVEVYRRF